MNAMNRPMRLAVACAFADALDRRDYDAARELLAEECVYDHSAGRIHGADHIIHSYELIASLRERLDQAKYTSAVHSEGDAAVVTFSDRVALGQFGHLCSCQERLLFDRDGYIHSIAHQELPGRQERLDQRLEESGVIA